MDETINTNETMAAPRKRTIKPPVDEIVITKAEPEVEDTSAPLTEQTKREMEAGRKALALQN